MIADAPFPRRATRALAAAWLSVCSCTSTLDPTVLVGEEDEDEVCFAFASDASSYTICAGPLSFEQAAARCVDLGGTLAAVNSAEEDDFISQSSLRVASGNFWLGGSRDDAFVWSWPDGSVFWRGGQDGTAEAGAYVRWQADEPNNTSTVATEPESCLALTQDGGDWNDRACSLSLPYVCEEPI